MWFLYVVECGDSSLYCGITTNVERRIHEHNHTNKGAKYTRSRRPVKLVCIVDYPDRSRSSKAEAAFKKMPAPLKRKLVKDPLYLMQHLMQLLSR